jgi:hypothetical protein
MNKGLIKCEVKKNTYIYISFYNHFVGYSLEKLFRIEDFNEYKIILKYDFAYQLLRLTNHLHIQKLAHHDLKFQNIMMTKSKEGLF